MPIPELNEEGFLPEGLHDCKLDEIGARFGQFQVNDRRVRLFENLCALVEEQRQAGLAIELIVDGSFVTSKPSPEDIDLVIVLPAGYVLPADTLPFRYNAISKASLRRRYAFDIFMVAAQSQAYEQQVAYFQQLKFEPTRRKGLLRIKL